MEIGLLSAIPYIVAAVAMLLVGRSSDRRGERRFHSAIPAAIGAVFLAAAIFAHGNLIAALTCMTIATAMLWVAYVVFWAMPSQYLKGDAAAGGIALINTIGLMGGFLSPTIIGWVKTATGSLQGGLFVMVGLSAVGAIFLLAIRPTTPAVAQSA